MSDELLAARLEYMTLQLADLERLMAERLRCVRDDVDKSFEANNLALAKAEAANDTRFESVNEFRKTLSDQSQEFLRVATYNTAHEALVEKTDDLNNRVTAMDAVARTTPQPISGMSLLIGGGSVVVAFIVAVVTGGIQLGALQTHVDINGNLIHQLQEYERAGNKADAKNGADIQLLKSGQNINEHRLDRLETAAENYFKRAMP